MSELKPCPFCGGPVDFNHNYDLEPDGIRCMKCRTLLRFMNIKVKKGEQFSVCMDKMAEVWNRRAK